MLHRSAEPLCAGPGPVSSALRRIKKPALKKDLGKEIAAVLSQPPLNRTEARRSN
jgi:hypothetical protein